MSLYYTSILPRTVGWRFAATPRERRTPPWCPCHASRGLLVTCRDTRITRRRHQVRITLVTLKIFGFIITHYALCRMIVMTGSQELSKYNSEVAMKGWSPLFLMFLYFSCVIIIHCVDMTKHSCHNNSISIIISIRLQLKYISWNGLQT